MACLHSYWVASSHFCYFPIFLKLFSEMADVESSDFQKICDFLKSITVFHSQAGPARHYLCVTVNTHSLKFSKHLKFLESKHYS